MEAPSKLGEITPRSASYARASQDGAVGKDGADLADGTDLADDSGTCVGGIGSNVDAQDGLPKIGSIEEALVSADDFEFLEQIGKGGFGIVWKVC